MLTLPSSVRIYVAAEAVDMRKGFDGLSAMTRALIGESPMSGHLFVFMNRRRNRIKLLVWDLCSAPGYVEDSAVFTSRPVLRLVVADRDST